MKRLSLMLLLLPIAGCAGYAPRPLDAGKSQTAFDARRLDAPAVRRFAELGADPARDPWPPRSWNLDALTLAAYAFHPDLDRALAQGLAAEAAIVSAGARPSPTAAITAQHNVDAPAGISPWTRGLGLDIPVETAGKRDYRVAQARYRAEAAKSGEADAVWQVRSRVRASLLASYPTETLMRRQRDLQADIAAMLDRRFALGYASQSELIQARLTLDAATLALRENQRQRAENLARLAAAIGVPVAALQGIALSYGAFEQLTPVSALPTAEARRQSLLTRPDVLAALASYEAAQSGLQLEIARQYPDLSIGPGYSWDAGQVKWSLGLSFALPLLDHNQGLIGEAGARREEAAAAFLSTQAKAIAEVDEAMASYAAAVRTCATADAMLQGHLRKERGVEAAFRAGAADRLTWLSAQYETAAADLARIAALIQAQQSLGRLEDALRRPLAGQTSVLTAAQVMSAKHQEHEERP